VTHWLDASIVYGSTVDRARDLRLGRGGLLRVEIRNNQQWPTVLRNSTLSCARPAPEQVCYKTGRKRKNPDFLKYLRSTSSLAIRMPEVMLCAPVSSGAYGIYFCE